MKSLLLFAGVAVAIYALMLFLLYRFQERLVYLPHVGGRALIATPANIDLEFETVWLTSEDGVTLHSWWIPAATEMAQHEAGVEQKGEPAARETLLFFHGNAANISHRLETIALIHRLGLDLLIIDYRGYGLSGGRPSEQGTYLDARAAWRYLTEQRAIPAQQIHLCGRSLGGGVAAWLAAEERPASLILESTFSSLTEMGEQLYPIFPVRWLSRIRYPVADYLSEIEAPVLVAHSPDDNLVPYTFGRRLFAAAREPKRFVQLAGPHNQTLRHSLPHYEEQLARFFDDLRLRRRVKQ